MIRVQIRRLAAIALGSAAVAGCTAQTADDGAQPLPAPGKGDAVTSGLPMITEVAEGTFGNNKAVELYNPLPFAASMDGCTLGVYSNGRTTPHLRVPLDGLAMQPQGTLLLCHGAASAIDGCDVFDNRVLFNGNDALELSCEFDTGTATLDVFGVIGEDPGAGGWDIGPDAGTANMTVRRSCDVATGHDAFEAHQWDAVGADNFGGLGEHEACEAPTPEPTTSCNLGPGILGGPSDAVFEGQSEDFNVLFEEFVFGNFTPQAQALTRAAFVRFSGDEGVEDAADALAGIASDGTSLIEFFRVRDTLTGVEYDAIRYFANDATTHSAVAISGTQNPVAFSFDGEFFLCDESFCDDGALSREFYEGLDENDEPVDRYEILEQTTVLGAFQRRRRIFEHDNDEQTLLTVAWREHTGEDVSSIEALERIARDNTGPLVYRFIAGPQEDYEAVVFADDGAEHGLLVVEDSLDPEALSSDGEVTFCFAP